MGVHETASQPVTSLVETMELEPNKIIIIIIKSVEWNYFDGDSGIGSQISTKTKKRGSDVEAK